MWPTVSIVATPNAINREGQARRINVDAEVKGRDLGSVVADVEQALTQIEFPHGYHPELIGEYAERQAAQQRILIAGLVAMLVIFAILRVVARELAAGDDVVLELAGGPGGRRAGGVFL